MRQQHTHDEDMATLEDFRRKMSGRMNFSIGEVRSPCRRRDLVLQRSVIAWYLYNAMEFTCARVGAVLGRDHATVIHLRKIFDRVSRNDNPTGELFRAVRRMAKLHEEARGRNDRMLDALKSVMEYNAKDILPVLRASIGKLIEEEEKSKNCVAGESSYLYL